jgi:hypothetical protein
VHDNCTAHWKIPSIIITDSKKFFTPNNFHYGTNCKYSQNTRIDTVAKNDIKIESPYKNKKKIHKLTENLLSFLPTTPWGT